MKQNGSVGIESAVPAVDRALDILELFETRDEPMTLAQVVAALSLPKASAYRLLSTLTQRGYVRMVGPRGYTLGLRNLSLAARAQERLDVVQIAAEPMRRLASEAGEACQISIRSGRFALCVARVSSPNYPDLTLIGKAGSRFPLHAVAVGKALLAYAPESERSAYISGGDLETFTPFTHSAADSLDVELADVRRSGLARDRQEYKLGLCAVAAPVFDHSGTVVAALAVPYLVGSEKPDHDGHLVDTAREVSCAMGYRG